MNARRSESDLADTRPAGPAGTRPSEPPRPGSDGAAIESSYYDTWVKPLIDGAPPISEEQRLILQPLLSGIATGIRRKTTQADVA